MWHRKVRFMRSPGTLRDMAIPSPDMRPRLMTLMAMSIRATATTMAHPRCSSTARLCRWSSSAAGGAIMTANTTGITRRMLSHTIWNNGGQRAAFIPVGQDTLSPGRRAARLQPPNLIEDRRLTTRPNRCVLPLHRPAFRDRRPCRNQRTRNAAANARPVSGVERAPSPLPRPCRRDPRRRCGGRDEPYPRVNAPLTRTFHTGTIAREKLFQG
jgi:hypothetical protein